MLLSLPPQLLEDVTLYLPMDPRGIRELRSVSRLTAEIFTDANLRNFTLDVDPMALIRENPPCDGLHRFAEQIASWCKRIQRARAVRYLDVTLACRSYTATSVMVVLYNLLGVTVAVGRSERSPGDPTTEWRNVQNGLEHTSDSRRTPRGKVRPSSDGVGGLTRTVNGDGGKDPADSKAAGVMDVLLRLRLADTGRDTFSGHALRHMLGEPATFFPALEHLTVVLRTWHARNAAAHDARGPMTDIRLRFPRLSNLTLSGTRWDAWLWEPTIRDIAQAPPTLRSIRLCFHADAEEAVLSSLALALGDGAFVGLEVICLRSTLDMYDSFDADRGRDDFNVGGAGGGDGDGRGGVVTYSDPRTFYAFGQGLGRLAPSLRQLEFRLQCDNSEHCARMWTEMAAASGLRGAMSKLERVAVYMCPLALSGLSELIEKGGLPALSSLEVGHPGGSIGEAAAATVSARDGVGRAELPQRLDYQFENLRLMGSVLSGKPVLPLPAYAWNGALSRVVSSLFAAHGGGSKSECGGVAVAGRLHTLSLDLGPLGCRGGGIQEVVSALLLSGACPRLRRLWLLPLSAVEEDGVEVRKDNAVELTREEERRMGQTGDGVDDERGGCGLAKVALTSDGGESRGEKRRPSSLSSEGDEKEENKAAAAPSEVALECRSTSSGRTLHWHETRQETVLCAELLLSLTSPLCPPALAEAFADRGPWSMRIPRPDRWWGV